MAIFALAERLPTFATLETTYFLTAAYHLDQLARGPLGLVCYHEALPLFFVKTMFGHQ